MLFWRVTYAVVRGLPTQHSRSSFWLSALNETVFHRVVVSVADQAMNVTKKQVIAIPSLYLKFGIGDSRDTYGHPWPARIAKKIGAGAP